MKKKRVLVGMSGGKDSTATCMMLQEQGYEVVGLTLRTFDNAEAEPKHVLEAKELAQRLSIAHYVADERVYFKDTVIKDFIDSYLHGLTPNPCVMCNPLFKFRFLCEWADRLDCEYIATGHYAQLKEVNGLLYIVAGKDTLKDQSYFLWRLPQTVLRRTLFPLGTITKAEVRQYLQERGFTEKAKDEESMEVCFVKDDYRDFLREQMPDIDTKVGRGKFVDCEGKVLGEHKGFPYYTVGQRKGLEIALGQPAYVLKLNAEKNTVMLGNVEQLKTEYMLVEQPLWSDESATTGNLSVRIRYRSKPIPCEIVREVTEKLTLVHLLEEASAITPGQSAVFYEGDRVVGGAFIASQRGISQWTTA